MAEQTSGVWVVCPQCGHKQIHHVKMERSTNSYIVDCDAGDGHRYVIDVSFEPIISIHMGHDARAGIQGLAGGTAMTDPDIITAQEDDGWYWVWIDAALTELEWFGPYPTEAECHEAAREACND